MWRNTLHGWGIASIVMHWLSALIVVGLFALGWWMTGLGYYDYWYQLAPWWHKSFGMLLLGLTLLRVAWRLSQSTPLAQGARWERRAAHAGHVLLYVLLLTVMVSGYLISTAEGQGISVFGVFEVPALIVGLPHQATLAGDVHWYAAWALIVLAVGHTLAALKHHLLDRRDTLRRMWWPSVSRRQ
ncbi:cytochrome b561 [Chromohalobacter marismortui]|uniref:Cytochrome b561 n=1 Tax=Chromohalobacter marismortui TaxID=42055 RepID=A0A4R7NUL1_9GAMM|nr:MULTISPECIES: cytochrome b [Chromohalobacter]MCI0510599.1 cytochrome b [Chromohalobacter sp.]MCI0591914.1 cytochrome b [Chromohalobacter sp.]TDU24824.1 cytochrome b561 [Chromohalobacter marismortui]